MTILKWITKISENMPKEESTRIMKILSTPKMESLRRYHMLLEKIKHLVGKDEEANWKLKQINGHKYNRRNKQWYFNIQWTDNTTQTMAVNELKLHDPLSVLKYGIKNKLANHWGWEWAKVFLLKRRELKGVLWAFKTTTIKKKNEIKYKFGVCIPCTVQEALKLDRINGNNLWEEAIIKELAQIVDFDTFRVVPDGEPLPGFKCIPYRIIFAIKFDGRRKARLVVEGHLTQVPKEDCYSPVVGMDGVRLGFMISRNNNLLVCAGDIGNTFLNGFSL